MLLMDVTALVPPVNHHLPRIFVTLPSPPRTSLLFYVVCIVAKLLAQNLTHLTYSSNWQDVTLEPRNARQNAILFGGPSELFHHHSNGDVPPKIVKILRTTYLVALSKDPTDHTKLRPLGIPSAIRRITAVAVIHVNQRRFAQYLLPFNVAIGVNGGIDLITNTFRLGVERYITNKEDPNKENSTPTRALVSLDIINMFNAMSREKLRQLIERDFPELTPLADMLYKEPGYQMVRKVDGTWVAIPVEEGFSQGCPLSPIFAAIVLNYILRKVHRDLTLKSIKRASDGNLHDDGIGGAPIILAYVDDTNVLIPLEDVEDFLYLFNKYGNPLGAFLNLTKTKILTSTMGAAPIAKLVSVPPLSRATVRLPFL